MNKAFTLVELAIVIVIIGLLVGGVLQGQELIKQAKIRHDIKRLYEVEASIATFYGKYNFLPGDLPSSYATRFFSLPANMGGDGNGQLEWWPPSTTGGARYFWLHLSMSNLITLTDIACSRLTESSIDYQYARFKNDSCNRISGLMYATSLDLYRNFAGIGVPNIGNNITIAGYNSPNVVTATYSPDFVRSMDEKMDDGKASSGKFRGANGRHPLDHALVTACLDGSGNYLNDESTIACRIIYEFGL